MTDELRRKCELEARKCKWDIGFEPPIGDPRNKDFIEADVKKITEALLQKEMEIENVKQKICGSKYSLVCQAEAHQEEIKSLQEKLAVARSLIKAPCNMTTTDLQKLSEWKDQQIGEV